MEIIKVLVVDDLAHWQLILKRKTRQALESIQHPSEVVVVATFEEACKMLDNQPPWHLLISDIRLGTPSTTPLGVQLIERATEFGVPSIAVTGSELGWTAEEYGTRFFFSKLDFNRTVFMDWTLDKINGANHISHIE